MIELSALLRYWRNSLADSDRHNPELRGAIDADLDLCRSGRLSRTTTEAAFAAAPTPKPRKGDLGELTHISVVVAPLLFQPLQTFEHGVARGGEGQLPLLVPIFMPARLSHDGYLSGDDRSCPWIAREALEPNGGKGLTVGLLADVDSFLGTTSGPANESWSAQWEFADHLFKAVAGTAIEHYRLEDARVLPSLVLPVAAAGGVSWPLISLCDAILAEALPNPMLAAVAALPVPVAPTGAGGMKRPVLRRHLGHMSFQFPLSPSQRRSVEAFLDLPEFRMLAINGPPGTGKTTLIQSLVACEMVERAIQGAEPPVILICSNNNQALTNALDSFAAVASDGDELAERWLPEISSYGLYLPSAFAYKRDPQLAERYSIALPGKTWAGLPEQIENPAYLGRAEEFFLTKAAASFPAAGRTVENVVAWLHGELKRIEALHRAALDVVSSPAWEALAVARRSGGLARLRAAAAERLTTLAELRREVLDRCESLPLWEELLSFLPAIRERRNRRLRRPFHDAGLEPPELPEKGLQEHLVDFVDQQVREAEQGAAVFDQVDAVEALARGRKDEERFLAELHARPEALLELLDVTLRRRLFLLAGRYFEGRFLLEMRRIFEAQEKLTWQSREACLDRLRRYAKLTPVMVSTFYRAPRVFNCYERKSVPLFQGIDLLIVDEAGQVSPEVGAPVFALAKRAVVVGDTYQIEPISSLDERLDEANLEEAGIASQAMPAQLRAFESSLMALAQKVTASTVAGRTNGLWLTEHRRCLPAIISYCNDLVYHGQLEPKRPAEVGLPLPAMGWAHVGSSSESVRGGRINRGAATALAKWLVKRREQLEQHYHQPLEKIVGIVTPFAAQRGVILEVLEEAELNEPMTVGTVHTFQGAERPVIVFLPVCSQNDSQPFFFDRGPNMLNVAVSRARDAFLVFGDMSVYDPEITHRPSCLLAKHLFLKPENELADVDSKPAYATDAAREEVQRLDSHEAHREILRRAFEESRERVFLASPYLRRAAIEADRIEDLVAGARSREVLVRIVWCPGLNGSAKGEAEAMARRLERAGAEVVARARYHAKTLAVDDHRIVEGSFNWLSAVRDPSSLYHNQEASYCVDGRAAAKGIEDVWKGSHPGAA